MLGRMLARAAAGERFVFGAASLPGALEAAGRLAGGKLAGGGRLGGIGGGAPDFTGGGKDERTAEKSPLRESASELGIGSRGTTRASGITSST